uniref:Uncharacterized protein n=1 Tax=Oryza glumipatula TaxID=40148 RepID=A0A0D9YKA2_9ORYZ
MAARSGGSPPSSQIQWRQRWRPKAARRVDAAAAPPGGGRALAVAAFPFRILHGGGQLRRRLPAVAAAASGGGCMEGGANAGSPPSSQICWRAEAARRVDAAAALPGGGRALAAAALPSRSGTASGGGGGALRTRREHGQVPTAAVPRVPRPPRGQGLGQSKGGAQASGLRLRAQPPPRVLARRRQRRGVGGQHRNPGLQGRLRVRRASPPHSGSSYHKDNDDGDTPALEAAPPASGSGLSDLYDLIVNHHAAACQKPATARATDKEVANKDGIEEEPDQEAAATCEEEEEDDMGFCMVGTISALVFSDVEEDWIVVEI